MLRWTEDQWENYRARRLPRVTPADIASVAAVVLARPVAKKPKPKKERSAIELAFIAAHKASGLPPMVEEFRPLPNRRFRIDFVYVDLKLGVECDGAVHRIKARFKADIERASVLTVAGWRIIRVGREQIASGKAIEWLRELMELDAGLGHNVES